jgi:hypothetical protein
MRSALASNAAFRKDSRRACRELELNALLRGEVFTHMAGIKLADIVAGFSLDPHSQFLDH